MPTDRGREVLRATLGVAMTWSLFGAIGNNLAPASAADDPSRSVVREIRASAAWVAAVVGLGFLAATSPVRAASESVPDVPASGSGPGRRSGP